MYTDRKDSDRQTVLRLRRAHKEKPQVHYSSIYKVINIIHHYQILQYDLRKTGMSVCIQEIPRQTDSVEAQTCPQRGASTALCARLWFACSRCKTDAKTCIHCIKQRDVSKTSNKKCCICVAKHRRGTSKVGWETNHTEWPQDCLHNARQVLEENQPDDKKAEDIHQVWKIRRSRRANDSELDKD